VGGRGGLGWLCGDPSCTQMQPGATLLPVTAEKRVLSLGTGMQEGVLLAAQLLLYQGIGGEL